MLKNQQAICVTSYDDIEQTSTEDCHQYKILLWFGCRLGGVDFTPCHFAVAGIINDNESPPGVWKIQEGAILIAVDECSTQNVVRVRNANYPVWVVDEIASDLRKP
ncbi:hypothetical protein JG688_00004100 [Phytophthora aleatoria]|uniref:Uncharacterized protein n=1 Tax=Phytophthora aleatoria TaxID=2496075 RepID=A0A8J5IRM0_9STRA|nr:hypothetical protein JG688_00004100 [Phytophthora aleatoria]